MSERTAAAYRAEELAFAAVRFEAAGPDEARTVGEGLLDGRLPSHITPATCRPEPRA